MNSGLPFVGQLRAAIAQPNGGIVGLVDQLLAICPEQGFQLDWLNGSCRIQVFVAESEEVVEVAIPRSAFRAVLARVAALCNEVPQTAVSPYGGKCVFTNNATAKRYFQAEFTNTSGEQRLRLAPVGRPVAAKREAQMPIETPSQTDTNRAERIESTTAGIVPSTDDPQTKIKRGRWWRKRHPQNGPTPLSTIELLQEARTGDHLAFEEIVRRLSPVLANRLARSRIVPTAICGIDDMVQMSFMTLYRRLVSVRAENTHQLEAWLFTVARHALFASQRSGIPANKLTDSMIDLEGREAEPIENLRRDEFAAILAATINELPEQQQQVIRIRHNERLSFAEIGARLGMTEVMARWNAFQARGRLLAALKKHPDYNDVLQTLGRD